MRGLLVGFAVLLALVGLIALVTSIPDDGTESGQTFDQPPREEGRVEIRGDEYRPSSIDVIGGTTVTFINRDDREHGVRFERQGLAGVDRIRPGGIGSVDARESGRYAYTCPLVRGMRGTLVVGSEGDA